MTASSGTTLPLWQCCFAGGLFNLLCCLLQRLLPAFLDGHMEHSFLWKAIGLHLLPELLVFLQV
jgi:hypothetical protein